MSDDQQACEVPLAEQLRSIPKDYRTCRAIQWSEDGRETGHQFIPVGFMMHRAADEIERLQKRCSEADQRSPLAVAEALGTVFCNMDADGDPVGAQPETDWEKGYAAGLRHVYRVLKQRGFVLPAACSAVSNSEGAALLDTSQQ